MNQNHSKKIAGALAIGGILGLSSFTLSNLGTVQAFGLSSTNNSNNFTSQLANKLGKSETEVRDALDEIQAEEFALRKEKQTAQLEKAVVSGLITTKQKMIIENRLTELESETELIRAQREKENETMGIALT